MKVNTRIRKLRQEKGLTQGELAKLLGVTKAAVQKYENGTINNLKRETIQKLCEIFECIPVLFIYDELPPNPTITNYFDAVKRNLEPESLEILKNYMTLTDLGKEKVAQYIKDISRIEEYKK